jgi:hypothetical protein
MRGFVVFVGALPIRRVVPLVDGGASAAAEGATSVGTAGADPAVSGQDAG